MNKKAFIHHPLVLAAITFVIGAIVMLLICKGIIPGIPIC